MKFKEKITSKTDNNDTKIVEKVIPLKYLADFWRNSINCWINLILTWSKNCFLVTGTAANQASTFAMTDIKLYVPLIALSTQDNEKLFEQLKSGFKRTINWNKYQSKVTVQEQNQYLDYIIGPSF